MKKSILLGTTVLAAFALSAPATAQVDDEIIVTATKRATTLQETPVAVTVTTADTIEKAQILDIKDLQSVVPSLRVSQLQNSANTTIEIRGFGNGGNNKGTEPAVGLFIDGVYRSRAAAQIADLPKLERVEVLSGPQSTLFGKNASAGVVSIVTARPSFETNGYIEGGVGNYNHTYAKGYISGPLSDTFAVSLGGGFQQRDGYFDTITDNVGDMNDLDRFNIRGQMLWEPSDTMSFRLIADRSIIDENCCGTTVAFESPLGDVNAITARDVVESLGGQMPPSSEPFSYTVYPNRETINEIRDQGVSLEGNFNFGNIDVTSITAYRQNENVYDSDNDFTSIEFLRNVYEDVDIDTFTQELRLTTTFGDNVDVMVGGYYFDESIDQLSGLSYGDDTRQYLARVAGVLGAPGLPAAAIPVAGAEIESAFQLLEAANGLAPGSIFAPGTLIDEFFTQENEAFSLFGTVDFAVTDRLTLTGGLNYTEDKKQVTMRTDNNDVFGNLDLAGSAAANGLVLGGYLENFPAFSSSCFAGGSSLGMLPYGPAGIGAVLSSDFCFAAPGVTVDPATAFAGFQGAVQSGVAMLDLSDPAQNPFLGFQALQFQPQFLAFPNSVEDGRSKDDKVTWTAKAAYDINDNFNAYVSAATGFKATSWNISRDSRPALEDATALQAAGLLPNNYVPATGANFGSRFAGPEEAMVYEIGLKGRFDKAAFSLALFDQTIEGFQSAIFQGTGFVFANAGEQSVQGIEFDGTYTPVEPLTLTFAATLLDPVYDSFQGAPGPDGPTDLSGEKPAGIPEVSISTSATYTHDLGGGNSAFIRGDYQYQDTVRIVDNLPPSLTREVSTFNGAVGVDLNNGVSVRAWARNLFNDEYYTSGFPGVVQFGTVNAYPNQPRTYGVNLRKSF